MHQFPAPAKPATFDTAVARHRAAVERLFKAGKLGVKAKPAARSKSTPADGTKTPKDKTFPPIWGNFKQELSKAQHRKCAFCEGYAIGQNRGDVEHFAPKAEVQALSDDETTWGVEVPYLANVEGRVTTPVSATGYWWLAYDWDNYILACAICNQAWKRAIFPIKEVRAAAPAQSDAETPYLLHPFRGEAPKDHLEYGRLGEIKARTTPGGQSRHGWETIRTLGLDRPSLRDQRATLAEKIHAKIDSLADAAVPRRLELLGDVHLEGGDRQPLCGMVRSIFEQRTGMTWTELETELRKSS